MDVINHSGNRYPNLLDVVLVKYTGLAARATEVNSISFKSVDSATYLDSIDAMNYPVRAPYGQKPVNISYENWIKFKLKIGRQYRKCLYGTSIQLPCGEEDCDSLEVYTKIANPRLWLKFQCYGGFDIRFGFAEEYRAPIRIESDIAENSVREIQVRHYNEEYSIEIPLTTDGEILLGDLEDFETDFFVTQLFAYKGCEFQNNIMKLELHYDLL